MHRILILNGPNLNLLGVRDPEHYGEVTLSEIVGELKRLASDRGCQVDHLQTNHEGDLIEAIHDARSWASGIIINPAAWTHYAYAVRDALEAVDLPAVEVHISDISEREPWRKVSVVEDVCIGQVAGQGPGGYGMALDLLLRYLEGLD
ncbi:MAG: type II 3-dehydroquinate dehydratase [bacterium]